MNRITSNRKMPSANCQVLGKYALEKERTISNTNDDNITATTLWLPAKMATKTNSPEVVH
jgi:hypothetical protein